MTDTDTDIDTDPGDEDLIAGLFARATERAEAAHEIAVAGQAGERWPGADQDLAGRLTEIAQDLGDLAAAIAVIATAPPPGSADDQERKRVD